TSGRGDRSRPAQDAVDIQIDVAACLIAHRGDMVPDIITEQIEVGGCCRMRRIPGVVHVEPQRPACARARAAIKRELLATEAITDGDNACVGRGYQCRIDPSLDGEVRAAARSLREIEGSR